MTIPILALLAALALLSGCTTRSRARIETQKAFRAGEQKGEMEAEARKNNVSFIGPVLNPIVPWTEGLTLGQAILAARWSGRNDPRSIIVTRNGERVELTPAESEAAAELPMHRGDTVELVP